jgi:hypothetical protein
MGFFSARERTELGKSPQLPQPQLRAQGRVQERVQERAKERVRNSVRDDFASRRRPPADDDVAGHVGSLVQRTAATSLREIDELILELRKRREILLRESARMQSEILEYAKLSQSTIQSTKIVTERLANFNKVSEVSPVTESQVENISNEEGRESGFEEFAERSGDQEAIFGQAEAKEIPDSPTSPSEA